MIPEDFARLLEVAKHRITIRSSVQALLLPLSRSDRLSILLDLAVAESQGDAPAPAPAPAPSAAPIKSPSPQLSDVPSALEPPHAVEKEEAIPFVAAGRPSRRKNLVGVEVGTYVGISEAGRTHDGQYKWLFRCPKCGVERELPVGQVAVMRAGNKSPPRCVCTGGMRRKRGDNGDLQARPSRVAAPEAPTMAPPPVKPRPEAAARKDAPVRTPATAPSIERPKQEPAPAAIAPGLMGESIRSLVQMTATRIAVQHPGVERSELVKAGMDGARRAAAQWGPNKGAFVSFANPLIREAMIARARRSPDDEDALLEQSMAAAQGDRGSRSWGDVGTVSDRAEDADDEEDEEAAE